MNLLKWADSLLGLDLEPKSLTFNQISLRGIIVFLIALIMVRLGDKRFLSKKSAFDAILGFILASMLARAVNGSAAFWPTLGGGFVLVGLHRLIAMLSRPPKKFGLLVKGPTAPAGLRHNDLSEDDLLEDLRLNGQVEKPDDVKIAYAERNGEISIVPKDG